MIAPENAIWRNVLGVLALVVIVPAVIIAKIVSMPFERPFNRSAEEVARYLRDFLNGTGGDWDWDDFISIPITDARLEAIRDRAAHLDLPMHDENTGSLQALLTEAEALAAVDRSKN